MTTADWIAWAGFVAVAVYVFGIAAGRAPVGSFRDEGDAHRSRLIVGWCVLAVAAMLITGIRDLPAAVVGSLLGASGIAVIWTARARASTDKLKPVRDVDLRAVARGFVFDSRPAARGPLEVHPKRRWSLFIALAGAGLAALVVGAAWDIAHRDHLELVGKLLFIVGLCGGLTAFAVVPAAYWIVRVTRRVPFLTIDSSGIVLGRMDLGDPALAWDDIESIDVRVVHNDGFGDRLLLVKPREPDWLKRQRFVWRIGGAITNFLYGSPFVISTTPLAVPFEEVVARIAAHRPALLQPEPAGDAHGAPEATETTRRS